MRPILSVLPLVTLIGCDLDKKEKDLTIFEGITNNTLWRGHRKIMVLHKRKLFNWKISTKSKTKIIFREKYGYWCISINFASSLEMLRKGYLSPTFSLGLSVFHFSSDHFSPPAQSARAGRWGWSTGTSRTRTSAPPPPSTSTAWGRTSEGQQHTSASKKVHPKVRKGRAAIRHYANQTARPLWPLRRGPDFTLRDRGVNARLA